MTLTEHRKTHRQQSEYLKVKVVHTLPYTSTPININDTMNVRTYVWVCVGIYGAEGRR